MSIWLLIGCSSIDWCERFNLECSESIVRTAPVDVDEDVWTDDVDCDDNDPNTYPFAPELCDGIDNDCDGVDDIGEGLATWLYYDSDGDGFGDPSQAFFHCLDEAFAGGWVTDNTDCDDTRPDVSPSADESTCPQSSDMVDNDCDGTIDEGELLSFYTDLDGDGQGSGKETMAACQPSPGYSAEDTDCDDTNEMVFTGATELCDNLDNDCDGSIDEDPCNSVLSSVAVVLSGEDAADGAGRALAGLGDVNSDGYDDIAVGASEHDGGGESAGAVYVLYGPLSGEIALGDASVRLLGATEDHQLGRSLARLGDINSDGSDDLLIGASADNESGTVYLLHGPLSAGDTLQSAAAQITGIQAEDDLGRSAAGLGDVDGDGVRDFAIGAWGSDASETDAGAVYVYSGPVTGSLTADDADGVLLGTSSGDHAGWSLDGAGDVDGDGFQDIVIGAYNAMNGAGITYLVRGPISGSQSLSEAHATLVGEREEEHTGWSVAGAGDTDGDAQGDLLIGAPQLSSLDMTSTGATWLVYGPVSGTLPLSLASAVIGTQANAHSGFSVSGIADRDGDGRSEILIGAYGNSTPTPDSGAAYLLRSDGALPLTSTTTTDIADWMLIGSEADERAGVSVDDAGDVNGDGRSDLLVGASGRNETGGAYLIY